MADTSQAGQECQRLPRGPPLHAISPRAGIQPKEPPASARDCKGSGNGWKGPGKRTVCLWPQGTQRSLAPTPAPPAMSFLSMKCVPSVLYSNPASLSLWSLLCCLALGQPTDLTEAQVFPLPT